jgi:hypothetical protein
MKLQTKTLGALLAASFAVLTSAHAQTFSGTVSSDPTLQANYSAGTAPTFGGTVADNGTFLIQTHSDSTPPGNPFIYSSGLGTTVFDAYTYIANTNGNSGEGILDMEGGNLSFGAVSNGSGNQNVLGDGVLNVSGGTINFLNGATGDGTSFWIGNNTGNGTVNLTGGTIITQNGILLGRDGSTGTANLTAGLFEVEGTTLTFNTASSNFNFTTGSTAELSVDGQTLTSYDALIASGNILVNGATATADEFTFTTSGSQGILELAAAPEPSTWAMLIGGFALLLGVQRLSRQRSV